MEEGQALEKGLRRKLSSSFAGPHLPAKEAELLKDTNAEMKAILAERRDGERLERGE